MLAQPVPQLARREQRDPRGRQLDREGKPVEPHTDLGHDLGVVIGELEPRTGVTRPFDEQSSCLRTRDGVRGRDVIGERQRRHGEEALAADPQRLAARHEHPETRARSQELGDAVRRVHHLLEVVEHQEHAPRREVCTEEVERPAGAGCTDRPRDGIERRIGVGHR